MRIQLNGEPHEAQDGQALDALVRTVTSASSGVAVAVNESVVPRGSWAATPLGEGDRVEILTAVQGG
ncbi:sulfur carrier protein ThiS [Streptomyces sp. 549]|uniref:sulfur carrier protein ThiS n=1 Tax=Streptomyces sp. 549 TaxID=3049076 RepID=UPI0024C2A4B0|nr:sulfur carrier protein ThiS [Streptomyces sp. 549]MDK1475571.1 sulfur carrier protein ThiS [Streptomyces sp. 549]